MTYDPRPPVTHSEPVTPPPTLSPYAANRPASAPRGNRPIRPDTTSISAATIPALSSITLHTMVKESIGSKPQLLPAIMAFRAISGETLEGGGRKGSKGVQIVTSKKGAAAFKLRAGMPVGVKVELRGAAMWDFLGTLVDFVLPRVRDWPGVPLPATSANKLSPSATSGVVAFGLEPSAMALFPQISGNLDMWPRMHGMHIQVETTARGKDAQMRARALLSGLGVPFHRRAEGKVVEEVQEASKR